MTPARTLDRLQALSEEVRELQMRLDPVQVSRNAAVRAALAEGWTHAEIARATGLTRGRIGQLAASG